MNNITVEKRGNIAILTINRPQALNALNVETLIELERAAHEIEGQKSIRALIITGAGKAFVAGADISEMASLTKEEAARFAAQGHKAFKAIDDMYIPVIAAINGYCLGGGLELALCADIRLASEKAKLGQPEVGLGITPGFGGTQRLPRVVGVPYAMQLTLTGTPVSASEALRMRLVNEVYSPETLMDEAVAMAEKIASNAPIAVHYCKLAMSRRIDRFLDSDLVYEEQLFSSCFSTTDQKMAMKAFLEKRPHEGFKGE